LRALLVNADLRQHFVLLVSQSTAIMSILVFYASQVLKDDCYAKEQKMSFSGTGGLSSLELVSGSHVQDISHLQQLHV